MKPLILRLQLALCCYAVSSCDEPAGEKKPASTVGSPAAPQEPVPKLGDIKEKLDPKLVEAIQISNVNLEFYLAVRKHMPPGFNDYDLLMRLNGRKWPEGTPLEQIAAETAEYDARLKKSIAEAKARRVEVDGQKLKALLDTVPDKFTAAVFGYETTGAEAYLQRLRDSGDPRGAALAEYLSARNANGDVLSALEQLCKLEGLDTGLHYEYAGLLLKAGRNEEALAVIKQQTHSDPVTSMAHALNDLRKRYLTEAAGLTPVKAAEAEGLSGALLRPGMAGQKLSGALSSAARALQKQADSAGAASYAAAALAVLQAEESDPSLYGRLESGMLQRQILEKFPELETHAQLTVKTAEWMEQLSREKVEYVSLEKFLKELKNNPDPAGYEQYLALEGEIGQVEALRRVKAEADAKVDLFDPSSVTVPK